MVTALDPDDYFDDVLYFSTPGGGRVEVGAAARWQAWWTAQAAGLEQRSGALAAKRGTLTVLDPRASTPADRWSRKRRAHALATAGSVLVNRSHVAAHRSAAIVHGLPTMRVPAAPELSVTPRRTTHRRGAHEATLRAGDVCRWWGVPSTTIPRTIADLMRTDRRDGLMAADAALHEGLVTVDELAATLARMRRWPGVPQARELLSFADPLAESPLESLTRLALHDDGVPPPELQVEIAVPGRRVPYRVDMLWPRHRLILEVDGLGKYNDAVLRRERRREAQLRQLGYRIERVLWTDVVERWPETVALLASALS